MRGSLASGAMLLGLFISGGSVAAEPAKKTFDVCKVTEPKKLLDTETAKKAVEKLLSGKVEAIANIGDVVRQPGYHAVIAATEQAFSKHYELVLSPDVIWLMVTQGVAQEIGHNPEKYRKTFVTFQGKKTLVVIRDGFVRGDAINDWEGVFGEFSQHIRGYIGTDTHKSIVADFSTTGKIEKAASEVVLMDAFQSYFTYEVWTRCGIPRITLLGTTRDWESVLEKTRAIRKKVPMDWWFAEVEAILDQFIAASKGTPDLQFWKDIYNVQSGSGTPMIGGWMVKLIPFVSRKVGEAPTLRNPVVTTKMGKIVHAMLPSSLSVVPFTWRYLGKDYDYQFLAGPGVVIQDAKTFSLTPRCVWAVREKPTGKVTPTVHNGDD